MKNYQRSEDGFTLVELAIVLVIIGLIVGGVLVGQDMIKAAQVRSTVGQYEKYNSAINTFRTKYNGIPGDLRAASATNFGLTTRTGTDARGDGDGRVEGCDSSNAAAAGSQGCETVLFWRDLSFANLIDGAFSTATDATAASLTNATAAAYFPSARVGRGNDFVVFSSAGYNYYELGDITATDADGVPTYVESLTPTEAFNIDNKVDDGAPLTGAIIALEGTTMNNAAAGAVEAGGVCVSDNSGNPYNTLQQSYADSPACQLRMRFN